MWVIQNKITKAFFAGWHIVGESISTTDSKVYAAHYPTWEAAVEEIQKFVTTNWLAIPKEEA